MSADLAGWVVVDLVSADRILSAAAADSMGSLRDCSSTRCSRLGLALCYLAVFVSTTLRAHDRYRILAFGHTCADLLGGWETRGEDFSCLDAMDAWSTSIRAVRAGGSSVYTAVLAALELQEEAARVAPCAAASSHVLIVVTDGEATDVDKFEAASLAIRKPGFPAGGFRALLLKIDEERAWLPPGRQLRDLGMSKARWYCLRRAAPTRPAHLVYQAAPLPASTNLSTPPGIMSSTALGSAVHCLSLATPTASRV